MSPWANLFVLMLLLLVWSCAQSTSKHGGPPAGFSRYDAERDYVECEYKARSAKDQHMYSQHSPFSFDSNSQNSADHVRALHGISSISAMRDTCLTAKGYSVE